MRSLSEILLPTDFSPRSADAARCAAEIARHFRSKVTLLHAPPPFNPAWTAFGVYGAGIQAVVPQLEHAKSRLDAFLRAELSGLEVKRVVLEDDPAHAIVEYASREQVGLIVMPTRGCTAFRRFLLGSVTAKVLHDVHCPVWTTSHIADDHPAAAIPKVIACAVDPEREGRQILQWASELAAELGARMTVVHAIPSLGFNPETYYLEADMRRAMIADARARITELLRQSRTPDARVCLHGGSVSTVVRAAVEDCHADLLIIGRASNKGMVGRLRTHSYALIRESPCPVLSI